MWGAAFAHCALLIFILLLLLSLLYSRCSSRPGAAAVVAALPLLLARLLPLAVSRKLGQRSVDVVRGAAMICKDKSSASLSVISIGKNTETCFISIHFPSKCEK